jgi:hypothetical protein
LGQWASGKTTASKTLVDHLGGLDKVSFINDRGLLAKQAVNYILGLDESKLKRRKDDGGEILESELVNIYLGPGEKLDNVDLDILLFDLHDEVYDKVPANSYSWMDQARFELGEQILEKTGEGKPIVIEAGFGTNTKPKGENPFHHTINDLFMILTEAGVDPKQLKWIIIEASYQIRAKRNQEREDTVPFLEFDRFAASGGDLTPAEEQLWKSQGLELARVFNNHNDYGKFQGDILAAFEKLFNNK